MVRGKVAISCCEYEQLQGRNETQKSPEGKYTDKAEGKPTAVNLPARVFLAPVGAGVRWSG